MTSFFISAITTASSRHYPRHIYLNSCWEIYHELSQSKCISIYRRSPTNNKTTSSAFYQSGNTVAKVSYAQSKCWWKKHLQRKKYISYIRIYIWNFNYPETTNYHIDFFLWRPLSYIFIVRGSRGIMSNSIISIFSFVPWSESDGILVRTIRYCLLEQ